MATVKQQPKSRTSRRDRARATRLRIAKAAYTLFCERGYDGTTMADIADAAGVAVQTVYFTFHTKGELLSKAYDFAVLGEGDPVPPEQQPWNAEMTAEPNLVPALRHAVEGIGAILTRATPLDTVVRASAGSDPETAAVRARHEGWRAEGYRTMLDLLSSKADLRAGVSSEQATQLLLMYVGMDVYRVLVFDFGWTHEAWVDWTVATVAEQIFDVR
ncbi:MAG TPA: helix-turn-helix domain-containing protein [Patescibacteria group bacterium]|nr:helix-turn-helix domain-containing protein [Patescibacteria group bacterium]